MSSLFNQVLQQLSITHVTPSPYHPESQGALEHYQSLKTVIVMIHIEIGMKVSR